MFTGILRFGFGENGKAILAGVVGEEESDKIKQFKISL